MIFGWGDSCQLHDGGGSRGQRLGSKCDNNWQFHLNYWQSWKVKFNWRSVNWIIQLHTFLGHRAWPLIIYHDYMVHHPIECQWLCLNVDLSFENRYGFPKDNYVKVALLIPFSDLYFFILDSSGTALHGSLSKNLWSPPRSVLCTLFSHWPDDVVLSFQSKLRN